MLPLKRSKKKQKTSKYKQILAKIKHTNMLIALIKVVFVMLCKQFNVNSSMTANVS